MGDVAVFRRTDQAQIEAFEEPLPVGVHRLGIGLPASVEVVHELGVPAVQ